MPYVYFLEHKYQPWIRIGRADHVGKRIRVQRDFELRAVVCGPAEDEKALHTYFHQHLADYDESTYSGDDVFDFVSWLLLRRFAGRDQAEADECGLVPYGTWAPHNSRHLEARDGQVSLFDTAAAPERLGYIRSDLIHLSSASDEWYTPSTLIEAARVTMGGIDLDPASCADAQRRFVHAEYYYTRFTDGLMQPWFGRVWLNPPYGTGEGSAKSFVARLAGEYQAGRVTQAITCINIASMTAHWFDPVMEHAACHLIYRGRPNFWKPEFKDSSPSKGVVLSYFGPAVDRFQEAFGQFGSVLGRLT